jgi:hypothetical protein
MNWEEIKSNQHMLKRKDGSVVAIIIHQFFTRRWLYMIHDTAQGGFINGTAMKAKSEVERLLREEVK